MQDVFAALERGATLLTAGTRLARLLRRRYSDFQQEQARPVWRTPDILPLDAWLKRAWREWVAQGSEDRVLLSGAQEAAVWEEIIHQGHGDQLLRIPETAQAAAQAWRLVQEYRIPLNARLEASEDCQAFLGWAREFEQRCEASHWLAEARLADLRLERPARVFVAGFDSFTPQQNALLDTFNNCTQIDFPRRRAELSCFKYQDGHAEIRAAAAAARRWLSDDPRAQIGIVAPDLTGMRAELERVFRETLGSAAPLHVSLGLPLEEHPIVSAAFLLLDFAQQPVLLSRAGMLLRSPFIGSARTESSARASLDTKLRRRGLWHIALDELRHDAESCPRLQAHLRKAEKECGQLPAVDTASGWSRRFWQILDAFGWPGERALNSREHQTVQAFRGLLGSFAALDLVLDSLTYGAALARLRRLAKATPFQVENEGAPVQIMGELEASGVEFEHLWVLGLHDEAWPRPTRPNAFLPLALQRQLQIPRSSAAGELAYSRKVLERLCASAREVILSHPKMEGERTLEATALVEPRLWKEPAGDLVSFTPAAVLEFIDDEVAPALKQTSLQSGGTRVFLDMAACPFRAFAIHRLGTREMEESEFGLAPREKGTIVHRALEMLWGELESQERLKALAEEDLLETIRRNVDAALTACGVTIGRKVEQARLERLLGEWLQQERKRLPFRVLAREQKREVAVGPLTVSVRADRVDVLDDGRHVILDYKTGEIKKNAWTGPLMNEPQVPVYCITSETEVAAAGLVQLRTGAIKVLGLGGVGVLPNYKEMDSDSAKIHDALPGWERDLEDLARRFHAGEAMVHPKSGACEFCAHHSLCRIEDIKDAG